MLAEQLAWKYALCSSDNQPQFRLIKTLIDENNYYSCFTDKKAEV